MDQLDLMADSGENPDGLDFILHESRIDLLENKVVLVVPEGSETDIDSFDTLASRLRDGDILLAMGNSDVPVGQYTQNILQWYGLDEEALAQKGCITYGSNVKEVVTQVSEGSVDAGVIYCTDAFSAGLSPVDEATDRHVRPGHLSGGCHKILPPPGGGHGILKLPYRRGGHGCV